MRTLSCLLLFVLGDWTFTAQAATVQTDEFQVNWPNFRGPNFDGSSTTATPPIRWSERQNVKWKVALPGPGDNSSPIVWNDQVFVLAAVPESTAAPAPQGSGGGRRPRVPLVPTEFLVMCYDRDSGEERWRRLAVKTTPHEGHHADHGFASASPFTDGQFVYAHFGSRGLYCYRLDGELIWKRDDFGKMQTRYGFGEGSSPVLHEDTIVVPWDHEGPSYVMALDARTGETKWKASRHEPSSWVAPIVVEANGKNQVIVGGQNFCRGYDLETGQVIWRGAGTSFRPTAGPVVIDNLVLVASNRRSLFLGAFHFDRKGDLNENGGLAWHQTNSAPDVPSMLLSASRVYYIKGNSNIFNCNDARTGKPIYMNRRLDGIDGVYASPVVADGKLIVVGRNGTANVLRDADEFEVLSTNELDDRIDATPALVGQQIFLRGKKFLYCISED